MTFWLEVPCLILAGSFNMLLYHLDLEAHTPGHNYITMVRVHLPTSVETSQIYVSNMIST